MSTLQMVTGPLGQQGGGGGVADSFNRSNTTDSIGTTDTGQTWEQLSGTWGIVSNTAYKSSGSAQNHCVVDSGLADCTIEVTLTTVGDGGLAWRAIDDDNLFLMALSSNGAIYRRTGGGFTSFGGFGAPWTDGDVCKVVLSGSSMIIYKNDSEVADLTDSQGTTATKHGFRDYGNTCRFDEFSVTE